MNRSLKILIAEDERIIAMDLKQTLEKLGFEVTSVVNTAVDVIQKVETEKPDVVLMDIMLDSLLDGVDAAKIISYKYNVPIIYVTAYNDEQTIRKVKSSKHFDYVIKPYDEVKLKEKIESAARNSIQDSHVVR